MDIESRDSKLREIGIWIIKTIQSKTSVNPRTLGRRLTIKIPSELIYKKLKKEEGINEIQWVKILKFLREQEQYSIYYTSLNIPDIYDGKSRVYFPEVYDEEGRVLVKTNREITNLKKIYKDTPNINNRKWEKDQIVYMPEPMAKIYNKIGWVEILENS